MVFTGSYHEVLDHFEQRLWTDGLPIVPPTLDCVHSMLRGSPRHPLEILGALSPSGRDATVWSVAANGVMAGCRPSDFPILLAVVECLVEPRFRIADAGSTTGWEPLVVLSGPDLPARGFNTRAGVMRVGRRANTAIGRFVRLYLRNAAGLRIPPGDTDMCALGQPTFPVMAEDDESAAAAGWPTLRRELGHGDRQMVVVVQGVIGTSVPIYSTGGDADVHLRVLSAAIAGCSAHVLGLAVLFGSWSPLLALSPAVASVFAREGLSKDDIRAALAARAVAAADVVEEGVVGLIGRDLNDAERDRLGNGAQVRAIPDPASLAFVLTGEPGRNQSKYYVPVSMAGERVSRVVG